MAPIDIININIMILSQNNTLSESSYHIWLSVGIIIAFIFGV